MVSTIEGELTKKIITNDEESKGATVFVGNLAYKTSWQNLKDYMGQVGLVSHASIFKDQTGRSKGCGLVEFKNSQDADQAIKTLNNTTLDGRDISVRPDEKSDTREPKKPREFREFDSKRERPDRDAREQRNFEQREPRNFDQREPRSFVPRKEFPKREFGGDRPPREDRKTDGSEVFVSNLSWDLSWQDLKDEFKRYGNVIRADIVKDRNTGRSAGYGFVTFENPSEAETAIEKMNGKVLKGREINVKTSTKKGGSPTKGRNDEF